jgi:hypothetical protein
LSPSGIVLEDEPAGVGCCACAVEAHVTANAIASARIVVVVIIDLLASSVMRRVLRVDKFERW